MLIFCNETMISNKRNKSEVQSIQMENLQTVTNMRRIDKMENERIRKLCGVKSK